jgi:hypothetical protein
MKISKLNLLCFIVCIRRGKSVSTCVSSLAAAGSWAVLARWPRARGMLPSQVLVMLGCNAPFQHIGGCVDCRVLIRFGPALALSSDTQVVDSV